MIPTFRVLCLPFVRAFSKQRLHTIKSFSNKFFLTLLFSVCRRSITFQYGHTGRLCLIRNRSQPVRRARCGTSTRAFGHTPRLPSKVRNRIEIVRQQSDKEKVSSFRPVHGSSVFFFFFAFCKQTRPDWSSDSPAPVNVVRVVSRRQFERFSFMTPRTDAKQKDIDL